MDKRLDDGFSPVWWSWLPEEALGSAPAATGQHRTPDHGVRYCPEGAEGTGESRPRANGTTAVHPAEAQMDTASNGTDPPEATQAEQPKSHSEPHDLGEEAPPPDPSATAAAILEQAHFEAFRIREQALADAEEARATILEQARAHAQEEAERARAEVVAEASRTKAALLETCREQVFYEGARLREEANAEVRQVIADAEEAAGALAGQARLDADRIREQAISEAERVKAAIVEHARELAELEANRIREESVSDAEEIKATIIDSARKEAEEIRAGAEREKLAMLEAAEDEAVRLHLKAAAHAGLITADDSETKLLRASEVGSRQFPEARRGFDPDSVMKWLKLVETSYCILEEELRTARREWERALEVLEMTKLCLDSLEDGEGRSPETALQHLGLVRETWQQSVAALSTRTQYHHEHDLASLLVRASQLETRLGKRLYGYSSSQVQHLLEALTTELARLEHQVGVLRVENDELRARMLTQRPRPSRESLVLHQPTSGKASETPTVRSFSLNGSRPPHGTNGT